MKTSVRVHPQPRPALFSIRLLLLLKAWCVKCVNAISLVSRQRLHVRPTPRTNIRNRPAHQHTNPANTTRAIHATPCHPLPKHPAGCCSIRPPSSTTTTGSDASNRHGRTATIPERPGLRRKLPCAAPTARAGSRLRSRAPRPRPPPAPHPPASPRRPTTRPPARSASPRPARRGRAARRP